MRLPDYLVRAVQRQEHPDQPYQDWAGGSVKWAAAHLGHTIPSSQYHGGPCLLCGQTLRYRRDTSCVCCRWQQRQINAAERRKMRPIIAAAQRQINVVINASCPGCGAMYDDGSLVNTRLFDREGRDLCGTCAAECSGYHPLPDDTIVWRGRVWYTLRQERPSYRYWHYVSATQGLTYVSEGRTRVDAYAMHLEPWFLRRCGEYPRLADHIILVPRGDRYLRTRGFMERLPYSAGWTCVQIQM